MNVYGTALEDFGGMVCSIKKGDALKITQNNGETCSIERATWEGSKVTLSNCIAWVPVRLIKICQTCSGLGVIGGITASEPGGETWPCPECGEEKGGEG